MARKTLPPRVQKYNNTNRPHLKWVVVYEGKRESTHKTKQEADDACERMAANLASAGSNIGIIKPEEQRALSLWREWKEENLKYTGKLDSVLRIALDDLSIQLQSKPLSEAIRLYKEKLIGAGTRHLESISSYLKNKLESALGAETNVATITLAQMEDWQRSLFATPLKPSTVNNHLRYAESFFNYCLDRDWIIKNPCRKVKKLPVDPADQNIPILDADEIKSILDQAMEPELRYAIILQAFCGLRTSEVCRLDDTWIEQDYVHVKRAKGHRERKIQELPEHVLSFLNDHKPTGKLWKQSIYTYCRKITGAFEEGGVERDNNQFRHSFITYYVAKTSDPKWTARQAGNSPEVIERSYDAVATRVDGDRWFEIPLE